MQQEAHRKVTAGHLKRQAFLYVRQSTVQQVFNNPESARRQYALRRRAIALGWAADRIVVIDCDQGRSGASAADREGFQHLVGEVGMGHAGVVMGLEVSRLARNSSDWHRLLEICALTETLILDEDGLYEPQSFNDRLLLGLKGTMSEAELHLLRARLRGGILSLAQRGELRTALPVGFVYDAQGKVQRDPDRQVRQSLDLFFKTFRRVGTAYGTLRALRNQGLLFPRRLRCGPRKGELLWGELGYSQTLHILHNPRYAGAFFFGRTRTRKTVDGKIHVEQLPKDEWHSLLPGVHEGYISWEDYLDNERRLRESAQAHGADRRRSPPREGPALLQGLLMCGRCGKRMTVGYQHRNSWLLPEYLCHRQAIEEGTSPCQRILGAAVDQALGELIVESMSPMALEASLAVHEELQARLDEADRLRAQQVERAQYEADLAQRRYMQVDPDNGARLSRRSASRGDLRLGRRLSPAVGRSEDTATRTQADDAAARRGRDAAPRQTHHGSRSLQRRRHGNIDDAPAQPFVEGVADSPRSDRSHRPPSRRTHGETNCRDSQSTRAAPGQRRPLRRLGRGPYPSQSRPEKPLRSPQRARHAHAERSGRKTVRRSLHRPNLGQTRAPGRPSLQRQERVSLRASRPRAAQENAGTQTLGKAPKAKGRV